MYKKYSKLRIGSPFLLLVVLIIFTLNPIAVKGDYWREEFDDSDIDEWYLYGSDWSSSPVTIADHSFHVEDGLLKTNTASPSGDIFQGACREIDFVLGSWTADVYNAPNWGWVFHFGRDADLNAETINEDQAYYWLLFWNTDFSWTYSHDPTVTSDIDRESINEPYLIPSTRTEGWHSYELIFKADGLDIYMDGDLIFSLPFFPSDPATFDSYNQVCLVNHQNSFNMYDNVTAIERGFTYPPPSDTDSNDDDAGFTILLFGTGSIMAITTAYTLNRYFKKKD